MKECTLTADNQPRCPARSAICFWDSKTLSVVDKSCVKGAIIYIPEKWLFISATETSVTYSVLHLFHCRNGFAVAGQCFCFLCGRELVIRSYLLLSVFQIEQRKLFAQNLA
ncbi:hypothetical protein Pan153_30630 [Gimesia panareensis]|uniref:Uncharacterized protein n=1 Tax=Gimesia panareensis TaxID=2527978 RepID=A0A518FQ54_9PLAN|nr:hypothetical protein Pan153_30630 [Gimesia panareensis]